MERAFWFLFPTSLFKFHNSVSQVRGKECSKFLFFSALVLSGLIPAPEIAFKEDHHSQPQSNQMR